LSGSFGGTHTNKMLSFSSNSTTYPGIISWITNTYNKDDATTVSNFDISSNSLVHTYYSNTDGNGTFYQGICTTGITFILDLPTTIYLNTSTTGSKLVMEKSYFTLQLIQQFKNFPFTATGTPTVDVSNNFYVLTFTSNGTITFYTPLEINVIAVGGGGRGGNGVSSTSKGGGGGAGGSIRTLTSSILPVSTLFTVSVGSGGGVTDVVGGGSSSFGANSTNYLTASGGPGGSGAASGYLFGSNGGAGGPGAETYNNKSAEHGYVSTVNPINVNGTNYSFSGGGGGGGPNKGGSAGLFGAGGAAESVMNGTGQIATSYGSGGGGGSINNSAGGAGAPGVVIIYFRFSKYD
jgi:hypothetical protein